MQCGMSCSVYMLPSARQHGKMLALRMLTGDLCPSDTDLT